VLGALQYKPLLISTQTYATYNVKYGGQGDFNLKRVDVENEMRFQAREEDLNWLQAMFISEPSQTKSLSPPTFPPFFHIVFPSLGFHFPLI
jgi:hypothetical protein